MLQKQANFGYTIMVESGKDVCMRKTMGETKRFGHVNCHFDSIAFCWLLAAVGC